MATDTLPGGAFSAPRSDPEAAHAGSGPRPTIAEVYEVHFAYVFRGLRGLGVRPDLVDDAVQDVFLVVQDKLPAFDGSAKVSTWLYAIVVRIARRYRERAAKEASRFVADEPACAAQLEETIAHGERLAFARRALSALDQDKREVFVLAVIEQLSAPEIAVVLNVPLNTVYSRLRAARIAFSSQVARLQGSTSRRSP